MESISQLFEEDGEIMEEIRKQEWKINDFDLNQSVSTFSQEENDCTSNGRRFAFSSINVEELENHSMDSGKVVSNHVTPRNTILSSATCSYSMLDNMNTVPNDVSC